MAAPGPLASSAALSVFATTDAVGGVWTYALELAAGLADRGVSTTLAILGPAPAPAQVAAAGAIPGLRLLHTGLPMDWTAPGLDAVRMGGARLAQWAEGADIVHLNSPAFAAGANFVAPVIGACHSCIATWWDAMHGGALPDHLVWQRDLLAEGYRAVDCLLAPTAAFAAATKAAYRLRQAPRTIHNGRIAPVASTATVDDFVFTAGRLWDQAKELPTLDRAAALLPYPLLAAGPLHGEDGSHIAVSHIHALGRIEPGAIATHLAARPVYVSAARYEPFGLAVLEAAQAGCALVLSDIPGFRELWANAADYVPPGDGEGFAIAIGRLMRDPALRARRGAAARVRAARYTVDAMVDGTLALYREVLAA